MFLLILFTALIIIYVLADYRKYSGSMYAQETGNPFLKVRRDTGLYGEYLTFNKLELIEGDHKVLANVYVPKEDGTTTEIDLVFIHETGIYVIESKNYSGWIFGSEKSKQWTQSFPNRRKERFYNPIWQNNTHIKHLRALLLDYNVPYYSIITFSERCTLKKIDIQSKDIKVINRYHLIKAIKSIIAEKNIVLRSDEINDIYMKLKAYTNVSEEVKLKHISNINQYNN